jgi:site-specific DNA-methyltransferase (adenine-specific)
VVCLVPARTDTAWWHDYAMKGQIRFLRGRLKFGGAANSAPFPSAVVVFDKQDVG